MAKMSALARAQLKTSDLKKANADIAKEVRATKRDAKKEVALAATTAGVTAIGGGFAGARLQKYMNENYAADSKARAITPDIPTVAVGGALLAILGVGFSKDTIIRSAAAGLGGGIAAGAFVEGTGLS